MWYDVAERIAFGRHHEFRFAERVVQASGIRCRARPDEFCRVVERAEPGAFCCDDIEALRQIESRDVFRSHVATAPQQFQKRVQIESGILPALASSLRSWACSGLSLIFC